MNDDMPENAELAGELDKVLCKSGLRSRSLMMLDSFAHRELTEDETTRLRSDVERLTEHKRRVAEGNMFR